MDRKFLQQLEDKENRCRNLQRQAEMFFRENNNAPCEDQCSLLQLAADLESEMSRLTMGAEREHHIREKNRLDYEIMRIRSEIDRKNGVKPAVAAVNNKNTDGKPMNNSNGPEKTKEEEELDRTVNTWYKDAPNHSFEDVSCMAELKKKLIACIENSKAEKLMDYLKIPHLNSYFFVGPPGCGKTFIIEAFAHELMDQDYKFISLQGSDIISRYVGAAEKSVTRLFEEAEKNAPCIVFIDEIDSLCKNRSLPNLPEYAANITTSFLTGYNRIHSADSKVIFIAATNYPNRVDNAMLDRVEIVRVPLPDAEAREAAFEKCFGDIVTLSDGLTFRDMAEMTKRCNYRDIERLTSVIKHTLFKELLDLFKDDAIAVEMLKTGKYKLTRSKFEEAVSRFVPSPKEAILNDLKQWEQSVQAITESSDTDVETLYEPDNDGEEASSQMQPTMQSVQHGAVNGAAVYALKDKYDINAETAMADISFAVAAGKLNGITACINGEQLAVSENQEGYIFSYKPQGTETEADVFVSDKNGYVGTFTAKFNR